MKAAYAKLRLPAIVNYAGALAQGDNGLRPSPTLPISDIDRGPPLEMALPLMEVAHDYAKRQRGPRASPQLVGSVGLVGGCGSDRICPCMAIRLVTRVR